MSMPRRVSLLFSSVLLASLAAHPVHAQGTWSRLPIPAGVHYHSVVFDDVHQRLIAFGGMRSGVNSNDVFVLPLAGTLRWQMITPVTGTRPDARNAQGMIYDPVGDRLIVFGGNTSSGTRGDVWALSLSSSPIWTQLSPFGPAPSARWGQLAVYDPVRYRMVVFGGHDGTNRLNEVWALSLAGSGAWSNLAPAGTAPNPRWGSGGVYDPVGDRLVLFGGANLSIPFQDTWALSLGGTPAWTNLSPSGAPPSARWIHAAAYDAARQRMLVFGGYNGTVFFNDAWALSLDGDPSWSALTPIGAAPSARGGTQWIIDPTRDRLVGFGGLSAAGDVGDVWTLSLADMPEWGAALSAAELPSSRNGGPATFDPIGQRMFLIGGFNGSFLNDVWALSLEGSPEWTLIAPEGTPFPARHSHTATFDPVRNRIIVFGGVASSNGTRLNDVWALSLAGTPNWSQLAPSGTPPPPVYSHCAIYDPVRDRVVVFGGALAPGGLTNRVWSLSLSGDPTWSELTPTGGVPAARTEAAAIYDPVRDGMVVYGGWALPGYPASDAWRLRFSAGNQWTQLNTNPPLLRDGHTGVYDPDGDRMIVFGGYDAGSVKHQDAWSLSLGSLGGFTQIFPSGLAPTARGYHAAVFDPERHRMLVFGGSGVTDADVWSLDLTPITLSAPPQHTAIGLRLEPAFPDPAPDQVTIRFALPVAGDISLRVFDVSGRLVRTLAQGRLPAGPHELAWDRRTASGAVAAPGLYFYELRQGAGRLSRRIAVTD